MTLAEKLALLSHCNGSGNKSNDSISFTPFTPSSNAREPDKARTLPRAIREAPLAREYIVRADEGATDTALAEILALPERYWRRLLEAIHPRAEYSGGLSGLLFFDLETTGLGGAGCYAFLTGTLCLVDGNFIIKQFFLPHPALELEYLNEVEKYFSAFDAVVSYNGLRFDAPLLAMRAARQRKRPFLPASHYDLLYAARAFWSENYENCRLKTLEREVCSFARAANDIDGSRIPEIYIQWLRDGNAAPLEPVFEHNRADLIALLHLAAHMAVIATEPAATGGRVPSCGTEAASQRGDAERPAQPGWRCCSSRSDDNNLSLQPRPKVVSARDADAEFPAQRASGSWAAPTTQALIWLAERARRASIGVNDFNADTKARILLQRAAAHPGPAHARIRAALLLTRMLRRSGEYQNAAELLEGLHGDGARNALSVITLAWIYERYLHDIKRAYALYTECREMLTRHDADIPRSLGKRCERALARLRIRL